jgi:protein O-mannosyl-transferase
MSPERSRSSFPPTWLCLGALAALVTVVYWQTHAFQFVNWDDPDYVTENARVLSGLSWSNLVWAFTSARDPYWHPLTYVSYLVDVGLFGTDSGAFHIHNAALHLAAVLLLWQLAVRLGLSRLTAALMAGVFAVHPLHVESVAWVAERKDTLSACWTLAAMLAYVGYVKTPRAWRYLVALGAFALALLAKPMAVTLPLLLGVIDVWPLGRHRTTPMRALVIEKLPFLALAGLDAAVTVIVQSDLGALVSQTQISIAARLANATVSYARYLGAFVWPVHLSPFYPPTPWPAAVVAGCAALLLAVSSVAIWLRRRAPYVLAGWLWFLVSLVPVIGLVQSGEQAMADRFMYLAMLGPLVAIGIGARDGLRRVQTVAAADRSMTMAAAVLVLAGAAASYAQTAHWATSERLWRYAVTVTPANYLAFENLGRALRDDRRFDDAVASYEQAKAYAPQGSVKYQAVMDNAIGITRQRQGRDADAERAFADAVANDPRLAEAQNNLGNALAAAGRPGEALPHFRAAVDRNPSMIEAWVGVGSASLALKRPQETADAFTRALAIDASLAEAHLGLGGAYALQGENDRAIQEYQRALQLKPTLTSAYVNLAIVLAKTGRIADARAELMRALEIDPRDDRIQDLLDRLREK